MMLTFRGPGSRKMQTAVFAGGARPMDLDLRHWRRQKLRLVTQYVHLGCALDRGASLQLEAQRRTSRAQGAFHEHRRRIYQNRDIPLPIRGTLFTAMVESTMFNLEIWGQPTGQAWEKLQAGHTRLLRRLVARDVRCERVLAARLSDLVAVTEHPPFGSACDRQKIALCHHAGERGSGCSLGIAAS